MAGLPWRPWMLAVVCAAACERSDPRSQPKEPAASADVTVTRPTVIAYFVIPNGAVDTLPDLAVEADDWNVAMAALGDSLQASGIGFTMATQPRIRIGMQGRADTTLTLGALRASGYIFVRPGAVPCVRPGGADPDSVKVAARAYARDAQPQTC